MIPLFWHKSTNFGDALSPWLVEKISGRTPQYIHPNTSDVAPYIVIGSIFGHRTQRGIVWGAGAAYEDELDPSRLQPPGGPLQVIATRGRLSQARVEAAGHCPVATGDPALLLSEFYDPEPVSRHAAGIICSWVDYDDVAAYYGDALPVLNASTTPVEHVIDTIAGWDVVISGCLHGLVAAIAYRIPVVWAKFSDRVLGDGFKFRDFFSNFGLCDVCAVEWPTPSAIDQHALELSADLRLLLDCCPFLSSDADVEVGGPALG